MAWKDSPYLNTKNTEPKVGENNVLLPGGKIVQASENKNPILFRTMQQRGAIVPSLDSNLKEYIPKNSTRGYWENPYRIARYHEVIQNAAPDWQAPDWLDVAGIEAAYKYLKERNDNKPWYQWKYLSENDPATSYLRNIETPPVEFLFPEEVKEIQNKTVEQNQIGTWESLKGYQQTWLSLLTPQPVTGEYASNDDRPLWSKLTAGAAQSILPAMAGAGIGQMVGGLLALIGATGGSAAIPVAIGAGVFGLASLYQNYTGKKLPVLGDIVQSLGYTFNLGAEGTEKVIGVAEQLFDEDNDFVDILENLGPAWQAGAINYETNQRNLLQDLYTKTFGEPGDVANEGQLYQWEQGLSAPQDLPAGYQYGVEALNDVREKIEAGADADTVRQEYLSVFGSSGYLNDFLLQSVLDPLNLTSTGQNVIMSKVAKATGNVALAEAFPKPTIVNVVVDALPMPLNWATQALSGGKLIGSTDLISGLNKYKTFVNYGVFADDYVPPKDYSPVQKMMADLTDEGLPKVFEPDKEISNPIYRWLNKMVSLTPKSKALTSYTNMVDHINRFMELANNDPVKMVDYLESMSKADPKLTGEAVDKILNQTGEIENPVDPRFFNSPWGAAVTKGLQDIANSGKLREFLNTEWIATAQSRQQLSRVSELMGIAEADVLDQITKGVDITSVLKVKAQEAGLEGFDVITMKQLEQVFKPFLGDDAMPFFPEEFRAKLMNMVNDSLQDFVVKRFGIEQDKATQRIFGIMKDVQSLLVLGLNPGYLINNTINNIVTRAADGVLGFMSPKQVANLLERLDIAPARADMGTGTEVSTFRIQEVIRGESDLASKAQNFVGKVKDKLGIFSNLSATVERSESRQAFTIGMKQMLNTLWVRDKGFRLLPQTLVNAIGQENADALYKAVENSYNIGELESNIFDGQPRLTANDIVNELANRYAEQSGGKVQPEIVKSLLNTFGIADELDSLLAKAGNNPNKIADAFETVRSEMDQKIKQQMSLELENLADAKKAVVQKEGVTAAINEFSTIELQFMREWLAHFSELETLYDLKSQMDSKNWNRLYAVQVAKDDIRFQRLFDWEAKTREGVFAALGFDKDNPIIRTILDAQNNIAKRNRKFFEQRNALYEQLNTTKFDDSTSFSLALMQVKQQVSDLWQSTYQAELADLEKVNQAYVMLAKDKQLAQNWRSEVMTIREGMINDMLNFRQELIDNPPESIVDRNQRWNEFIDNQYKNSIMRLKQTEAQAQNLYANGSESSDTYWRDYVLQNKLDDTVPEALRTAIIEEAQKQGIPTDQVNRFTYEQMESLVDMATKNDPAAAWILGEKETPARLFDGMTNRAMPDEYQQTFKETLPEVAEYWYREWYPKQNVKNIFERNGFAISDSVMAVMDSVARSWALKNNATPGEWYYGVLDRFVQTDQPLDNMTVVNEIYDSYVRPAVEAIPESTIMLAAERGIPIIDANGKPLNKYLLNIVNQTTGKKYKSLFNVPLNEIEVALMLRQIQLQGEVPLNTTPDPSGQSLGLAEIASTHIYPLLDSMQELYKAELPNHRVLKLTDIPEQYQAEIRRWVEQVKGDMASTKLVSQKWGEQMRDTTLLNYNKRTGFDEFLSYFYPYSFWYTHSMINWASRMVQKPAIFALYYRYREMQKRMERDGIPQRLKGKIRIPAAYLPDWMGNGYFIDPMKQWFPFAQFTDPYNSQVQQVNSLKYATFKILADMVDQGLITDQEATTAKENQSGTTWDQAYAQAVNESDFSDPISLASMMMTPAMYLTIPYYFAKGTPEKISPTPLLKSSQAVKTVLQDTPLEAIGNLVGALGEPERLIREGMGLTEATALFGEFGDYYVDRQLANMVADGEASLDEAQRAMIERQGDVYQQALQRVKEEVSLKVPGILPFMAAKGGATAPEVASALFFGMFPGGLLPQGELEYLELKDEYTAAWELYKLGDKNALSEFYDKYPVFQARSALNDEPDDRMRNFLVGGIWDRYMALDSINRGEVIKQLGLEFEDRFINKETRNTDSIPLETLAKWAMVLGAVPLQTEELQNVESDITLDLWNPQIAAAYTAYQEERNTRFPNWYAIQQNYYNLPKNQRGAYLKSHPELSEYWNWKRRYVADNPVIQPVLASQSAENDIPSTQKGGFTQEELAQMPEELFPQLMSYFLLGADIGPGAWTYLYYLWENAGQPYGNINDWIEYEFKPSLIGN